MLCYVMLCYGGAAVPPGKERLITLYESTLLCLRYIQLGTVLYHSILYLVRAQAGEGRRVTYDYTITPTTMLY